MIIIFCSCVMFSSFALLKVFFSVLLTFSGFSLMSLLSLIFVLSIVVFSHLRRLFVISSNYLGDPHLDITWSSYGRPLSWDSRLRVDRDPSDHVIQPKSFTTAGANCHIPIWEPHRLIISIIIDRYLTIFLCCCYWLFRLVCNRIRLQSKKFPLE